MQRRCKLHLNIDSIKHAVERWVDLSPPSKLEMLYSVSQPMSIGLQSRLTMLLTSGLLELLELFLRLGIDGRVHNLVRPPQYLFKVAYLW